LKNVDLRDVPGVEIDPPLERPAKTGAVERDDPAFFDDHVIDNSATDQFRA